MRSLAILALLSGLAVCRLAAAAPPADCRAAGAPDATADHPVGPSCRDPNLTQRRPGFWTLEEATPGPGRNAADPEPAVLRGAGPTWSPAGTACTRYPLPVVVGGQPLQAIIVACPQADGSWQVIQYTPGLPPQVYTGPAPPEPATFAGQDYGYPENYGYPEGYPDWTDWPWFSGFAPAIITGRKFRHFGQPFDHRFPDDSRHRSGHDFGHGLVHGAGHGLEHGFGNGLVHGFGNGLAHGFGRGGSVAGTAGSHR